MDEKEKNEEEEEEDWEDEGGWEPSSDDHPRYPKHFIVDFSPY